VSKHPYRRIHLTYAFTRRQVNEREYRRRCAARVNGAAGAPQASAIM
jgi:hypothetical protein